ncbi:MAG TPA: hypothetical protein HA276_07520 [Candidatus Poseidoniaceae archaeon]|nr:MAG TPA: hypothetical protein D7I01_07400 [Candidatus Poseidoniales archaeon]HII97524.1 hypothetical protein [Candidatus Poseidoniaceae archaeon]
MEGTPQIALMLLVLGLLSWTWPRPFGSERVELIRRWVPLAGWSVAMLSRFVAALDPSDWPHFAARIGTEASLVERLAAVVSGDGLVLIGMAIPLWWAALRTDEDATWTRAEVVLPLALCAMLGLEGSTELVTSAPPTPTVGTTAWDGALFLSVLILGAAWMGWFAPWTTVAGAGASALAFAFFVPMLVDDPALQAHRGPALFAAVVALTLSPRAYPRPSLAPPQGLAVWLGLNVVVTTVLVAVMLPRFGGYEGWAVVGVLLRTVTVSAMASVVALLLLRLGLDAQSQATWTMGRRAWSVTPLLLIVVLPATVLVATSMCVASWVSWAFLRWWPTRSETDV